VPAPHPLGNTPDLAGAACIEHVALFDATAAPGGDKFYAQAIEICTQQCPVLGPCRQWRSALPKSQKPAGVMAGLVKTPQPETGAA
jgi:hypothetical protein